MQNGDAMTVGQAWQDVKSGTVKADDIDTLNTLLKYDPPHPPHSDNVPAVNTAVSLEICSRESQAVSCRTRSSVGHKDFAACLLDAWQGSQPDSLPAGASAR